MKGEWISEQLVADFEAEKTDAYRLCTRDDGAVERFGKDVLVSFRNAAAREQLSTEFFFWAEKAGFVLQRMFGRFLPRRNAERETPKLLLGAPADDLRGTAGEGGLRYGTDFGSGYSVGLFIDQRANRRFVRQTKSKRMLNCFAYTCSFSVVAAAAGASTVSIDLSRKSLERGRENFLLNQLPLSGHHFITDDVFNVLPRLARRGERFDLIVLDPPTFSRSKQGRAFQVESDFEGLLLLALEVADRETRILLSTNCTTFDSRALEVMARFCLKTARRAGRFHREPSPVDFPAGHAASTVWLTLR